MGAPNTTPGPWAVDTDLEVSIDIEDDDNGQVASGWMTVASETHAGFAAVVVDMNYPNSWNSDRMEANAHLIAASPDLYDALEQALALIDDMSRFVGLMSLSDYALFNGAPIAARAALSLARGETGL